MLEIRLYGSEVGGAARSPYPYDQPSLSRFTRKITSPSSSEPRALPAEASLKTVSSSWRPFHRHTR